MTLLDDVPINAKVGLDTAPLIYWIENHPLYHPRLFPFFDARLEQGLNEAVTSVVSLAEIMVKPFALGRNDLVDSYRAFFTTTKYLTLSTIGNSSGERAANLRARHNIRLPDAFQIAAALENGAQFFLTNDAGLRKVTELRGPRAG